MEDRPFAELFPAATRERWLGLVDGVLKGGDFEKRLVGRSADGIRIEPLYEPAAPVAQPMRAPGPWRIAQRLDHPDAKAANGLALADLEGGADALTLVFSGAPAARGFGLNAASIDDLDAALGGVMLPLIALRLDAGAGGPEAARLVKGLAERRGDALGGLDLDLGLDPIGALAATGGMDAPFAETGAGIATLLTEFDAAGFAGRACLADGRPYHEAGASEAAELAAILATALAYLRMLEAGGHDLARARDAIGVVLVADADQFLTIAKFRAMRRLWSRFEAACGLAAKPLRLHAETAWRMMSRRDPFVNILRTTTAACSAGLGGADSVTTLPYTAALGLPDAFARRVARNSQIVLIEESNLARVADPAAGAGSFESLTEALAEAAWAAFQDIEREGGIVASLGAGKLQTRIAAMRATRARNVATRREALTGASEFPFLAEKPVTVLDLEPMPSAGAVTGAVTCKPLPSVRLAEPYEALRDASDAHLARHGRRPAVFLANLGPVAAFNARSTFAANAFAAGGVEALDNDGFSDSEALARAFTESGAAIACLCSSDAIYAAQAVPAAEALRGASAGTVYLAGKPGDLSEPLKSAGVHAFLYAGCDLLSLLEEALERAACA